LIKLSVDEKLNGRAQNIAVYLKDGMPNLLMAWKKAIGTSWGRASHFLADAQTILSVLLMVPNVTVLSASW